MATELYTFDYDGDLLLVLSRPADATENETEEAGERICNTPAGSPTRETNGDGSVENGDAMTDTAGSTGQSNVDDKAASTEPPDNSAPKGDETSEEKEPDIIVHMLVSSKHMMLASPVFKAMLQHNTFKEGRKLRAARKVEVPLPDDDPTPFRIILDIIHGRNRQVPRKVDLETLTSISIVVDKYQMAEAVESLSDGWIEALREGLPTKYETEKEAPVGAPVGAQIVHRWLGISWVFGKDQEFKAMSELIERNCYADLKEDIEERLPIPDLVLSTLSRHPQFSLKAHELQIQSWTNVKRHCLSCMR